MASTTDDFPVNFVGQRVKLVKWGWRWRYDDNGELIPGDGDDAIEFYVETSGYGTVVNQWWAPYGSALLLMYDIQLEMDDLVDNRDDCGEADEPPSERGPGSHGSIWELCVGHDPDGDRHSRAELTTAPGGEPVPVVWQDDYTFENRIDDAQATYGPLKIHRIQ